jgi:hypothetical protein
LIRGRRHYLDLLITGSSTYKYYVGGATNYPTIAQMRVFRMEVRRLQISVAWFVGSSLGCGMDLCESYLVVVGDDGWALDPVVGGGWSLLGQDLGVGRVGRCWAGFLFG